MLFDIQSGIDSCIALQVYLCMTIVFYFLLLVRDRLLHCTSAELARPSAKGIVNPCTHLWAWCSARTREYLILHRQAKKPRVQAVCTIPYPPPNPPSKSCNRILLCRSCHISYIISWGVSLYHITRFNSGLYHIRMVFQ